VSAQERLQATARNGGSVDVAGALIDHLDLWTGAITKKPTSGRGSSGKIELTGIKKLRELILQLAVMGKLVTQDAGDESASSLLQHIDHEIANLVKQRCIKAPKRVPAVEDSDKAFDIPESWQWVKLGDLALHSEAGWSPKCHDRPRENENWGVLKVSAVTWGEFQPNENKELPSNLTPRPEYEVRPSDFLISRANTAELVARSVIVPAGAPRKLMMSDKIIRFVFSKQVNPLYLNLFNNCSCARAYYLSIAGGTSSSMKNVSRAQIQNLVVPLPPKTEQHRIVQKVDELMALCDRLEQQTSDQLEAHETLVDTLLGTLTQSENATELADNWARLAAHFDTLFTTEQSIDKLKQTILQLAVMGRLVEQDAGDEPASVLLGKLNDSRVQVLANKKTRAAGKIKPATSEDQPFHLPTGWVWCRFEQLIDPQFSISYGVLVPGTDAPEGVPLIRVADLSLSPQQSLPEKRISPDVDMKHAKTRLVGGEILLCVVGSIGKIGIAPRSWKGANIARAICRLMPSPLISKEYLLLLLQTDLMQKKFGADTRTLAQPTLNVGLIKVAETPLPPLAEQHRIVQKVDELMALCDQLKERLNRASETRCQLAEAVVEGALN
jgi:type I restriction enzyme S subunit